MSVEAVVARVEQLQQLFSAATAPGGNGGQDFASQLTAATSAAAPATAVAPAAAPAGARGLTQLMPATAASLGVTDVTDPAQALEGGAKYLKQQLDTFNGDVTKALAAYNAGPGAVQRYGGVPPYAETQAYVQKVQAFAAAYRGTAPVLGAV